jgi:hypothetical protein
MTVAAVNGLMHHLTIMEMNVDRFAAAGQHA